MNFIEGGNRVTKGYYFSAQNWSLNPVATDGRIVPARRGERYLRIPLLVAVAVAPE